MSLLAAVSTMTAPSLSAPVLYRPSDLESSPALVTQIIDLINDAFTRSKLSDPVKWGKAPKKRFPENNAYFEMLGQTGVVGVIFDRDAKTQGAEKACKVVAVAAAVPWQGGREKEGAGVEDGWEIKAVAVDGSAQYLHRGLAVQLYTFLEQHLVLHTSKAGISTTGRQLNEKDQLTLWILAAECINGVYWRKRGYREVRKNTYYAPTWDCETSFEMIVLRKDVPLDVTRHTYSTERENDITESTSQREVEVN